MFRQRTDNSTHIPAAAPPQFPFRNSTTYQHVMLQEGQKKSSGTNKDLQSRSPEFAGNSAETPFDSWSICWLLWQAFVLSSSITGEEISTRQYRYSFAPTHAPSVTYTNTQTWHYSPAFLQITWLWNSTSSWKRMGTTVAQWLRCCATNRKVAGSIPDGVNGVFHLT